jgi:hypothetical protein
LLHAPEAAQSEAEPVVRADLSVNVARHQDRGNPRYANEAVHGLHISAADHDIQLDEQDNEIDAGIQTISTHVKPALVDASTSAAVSDTALLDLQRSQNLTTELLSESIQSDELVGRISFGRDTVLSSHAPVGNPTSVVSIVRSRRDRRRARSHFRRGHGPALNSFQLAIEAANYRHRLNLELEQKRRETIWFLHEQSDRRYQVEVYKLWFSTFERDDPEYDSSFVNSSKKR